MEGNRCWIAVTAVAPVLWGSTYYLTHAVLPEGMPLWGAILRALPGGLLLLLIRRRLPRGAWWWRSVVLGTLTTGPFFVLVYFAAQTLPSGIASMIMALSPVAMMGLGWLVLAERPSLAAALGAAVGIGGAALILTGGGGRIDPWGVAASVAGLVMSSVGFVLARRWRSDVDPVALTSWQLVSSALLLLPVALVLEGGPPELDGRQMLAFAYMSVVATGLAYVAWNLGLAHLRAGTVGIVGLLNPVTGVLVGTFVGHEPLTAVQGLGVAAVLAGIALAQRSARSRTSAARRARCRSAPRARSRTRARPRPARTSRTNRSRPPGTRRATCWPRRSACPWFLRPVEDPSVRRGFQRPATPRGRQHHDSQGCRRRGRRSVPESGVSARTGADSQVRRCYRSLIIRVHQKVNGALQ